jgi:aconitate hydratase
VRANYLASPPLVVAYALAGSMTIDLTTSRSARQATASRSISRTSGRRTRKSPTRCAARCSRAMFKKRYANVFEGPPQWQAIETAGRQTYAGTPARPMSRNPPYFENMPKEPGPLTDVKGARAGDLRRQHHHRPHLARRQHQEDSPAGEYLIEHQVRPAEFNSYGARRGNHEVMMRGTFANIRIKNEMVPGTEGGMTKHMPDGDGDADLRRGDEIQEEGVPLVVIAGKEYGTGSSRDWAAKGTRCSASRR